MSDSNYSNIVEIFETSKNEVVNERLKLGWVLLNIYKENNEVDVNQYSQCVVYVLGRPFDFNDLK